MEGHAAPGSTIAFIIFLHQCAFLVAVLARAAWNSRRTSRRGDPSALGAGANDSFGAAPADVAAPGEPSNNALTKDTCFLFDVLARENERIVQNVDTLDNALIAIIIA